MRLELPRMGHEVTVCPDGATALAALDRNVYDCLPSISTCPALIGRGRRQAPRAPVRIPGGDPNRQVVAGRPSDPLRDGACDDPTKPCTLNVLSRAPPRGGEAGVDL